MFKRIALAIALTLALSAPAMAENSGFYVGLKFLDSIQSTGSMSRSGAVVNAFDVKNYSQNTVGGGIYAGYDFYSLNQVPLRAEIEYDIRTIHHQLGSQKRRQRRRPQGHLGPPDPVPQCILGFPQRYGLHALHWRGPWHGLSQEQVRD